MARLMAAIYVYFPAYYTPSNAYQTNYSMILNSSAWAIYSNNPHSSSKIENKIGTVSGGVQRYQFDEHINSGDVGISKTSSVNVNNYSLNVKVTGKTDSAQKFDNANTPYYALYRMNGDKKEYAMILYGANSLSSYSSTIYGWYSKEGMVALKPALGDWFDENGNLTSTICNPIANYSMNFTLNTKTTDIEEYGRTIYGLAPGEYYIEELTIGTDAQNNIKQYHYQKATKPFKVTIGQKYNPDYAPFSVDTKDKLIDELSVTFAQEDPADRTIDSEVVTPAPAADGDKHSVIKTRTETEAATADGLVEVRITHNSLHLIWLPETGGIGTTIFFIVGGIIVVAATVLIVTRFRVKRERL